MTPEKLPGKSCWMGKATPAATRFIKKFTRRLRRRKEKSNPDGVFKIVTHGWYW